MKIAFVTYQGMTILDFVGVYDPVTRLKTMGFMPEVQWNICAITSEVGDQNGLRILPTQINETLEHYDLVIVPGGVRQNLTTLLETTHFLDWLKTAKGCPLKASVCTGSLLLGQVEFLVGKKATTHPSSYEDLAPYCETVVKERIVEDKDIITAGGVTASIDLGLYLCKKIAGNEVKEKIRRQMDYKSEQ